MREIIKAALQTGSGSIVTVIFTVLATKIMAVILGTEGVGLFSVLNQLLIAALTLATFSGGTALVQGIASSTGREREEYLGTVWWILVAASAVTVGVLIILAEPISHALTNQAGGDSVALVQWLAAPMVLSILYGYTSGVLNGLRDIRHLALATASGPIAVAVLAYPTARLVEAGYSLAFIGLMTLKLIVQVGVCLRALARNGGLQMIRDGLRQRYRRSAAGHFFRIAGVMVIAAQFGNIAKLLVNASVIQLGGLTAAGLFNAGWNLSMSYLTLITTAFSAYYLPTLAGVTDQTARTRLMENITRLTMIAAVPLLVAMSVFKPWIMTVLYSAEFIPANELFRWMIVGNYFKITGFIVAMPVLAYADMKVFFVTETAWYVGFAILSQISLSVFHSVEGIGLAFIFLYAASLIFYFFYSRKEYGFMLSRRSAKLWLLGLFVVVISSVFNWTNQAVDVPNACFWIAISMGFAVFVMLPAERHKILVLVRPWLKFSSCL